MTKFVGLRSKKCCYSKDDGSGAEEAQGTKKRVIKQEVKFF